MLSLSVNYQADVVEAFNSASCLKISRCHLNIYNLFSYRYIPLNLSLIRYIPLIL